MLEGLDSIPWDKLSHAYGSAADVPELLRTLRGKNSQRALSELFGNIWHQGTVYEATAYAVPFLIELAADARTPGRSGILDLLAAIADGVSYLAVHGNLLAAPNFSQQLEIETGLVVSAHQAVAKGIPQFIAMTGERGNVSLAAAHVLAQFPESALEIAPVLHSLLESEKVSKRRAGLLLLLATLRDRSEATLQALAAALVTKRIPERRAAAILSSALQLEPEIPGTTAAILEAMAADDFDDVFDGLPWDVMGEIDVDSLSANLDPAALQVAKDEIG